MNYQEKIEQAKENLDCYKPYYDIYLDWERRLQAAKDSFDIGEKVEVTKQ